MSESGGQAEQPHAAKNESVATEQQDRPDGRIRNITALLGVESERAIGSADSQDQKGTTGEGPHRETIPSAIHGALRQTEDENKTIDEQGGEIEGGYAQQRPIEQEAVKQKAIERMTKREAETNPGLRPMAAVPVPDTVTSTDKSELPASPPPPAPPQKDNMLEESRGESEYDEKHPPPAETHADVPEAPQGTTEFTGAEIQTIMDQFRSGMPAPGEEEIMSPRRDRQQSVLVLPPRSSSLEPRDPYPLSPQTTGQSFQPPPRSQMVKAPSSATSGPEFDQVNSGDADSIVSSKAGSIFHPPPHNLAPEPTLPFDFHRFLEQLRHRTADPVARFLRSFLNEFGKKQWMVHEQVKIISDFLEFISKKMALCEVWRTVSDAEFDNAREGMEKLVMNRLYSQTFSPAIPLPGSPRKNGRGGRSQADVASPFGAGRRGQHQEDVERDEVVAQKIRIYCWIREEHLDIPSVGEKGQKFLTLAQQELLKINTYRAPRDKVICVLNCCKVIFGFLKNAKSDQSADSFIPLLIYTVLRALPEHLVSNVQYIWRFRNQDKLGGEAGYYMSSLMGVLTFIENLGRTSLTISDEDFEMHVEQAVSAIAEENKSEEYENRTHVPVAGSGSGGLVALIGGTGPPMHHLSEKSALSRAEVTPRNSMEAEQSSPRRNASTSNRALNQRLGENVPTSPDEDGMDAMTGLLRTIQKPLSSIGRMFSDDQPQTPTSSLTARASSKTRGLSPSPRLQRRISGDGRAPEQPQAERSRRLADGVREHAVAAQATEDQRVRAREHRVVVE